MRDAEFQIMLDRVGAAMAAADTADFLADWPPVRECPTPANDNNRVWLHEPFPDGWVASC